MLRSLSRLVSAPAVVVCLFLGTASFLAAATASGPVATLVAIGGGVCFVFAALVMVYLVWLKRVTAEINSERRDLAREAEEILDRSGEE